MNTVRKNVTIYSIYWYTIQLYSVTTYFFCCCDDNKIKLARKPGKKQKAEIDPTRLGLLPSVETAFKLLFGTKWIQVIPKHQTHIHDKNVSLFRVHDVASSIVTSFSFAVRETQSLGQQMLNWQL